MEPQTSDAKKNYQPGYLLKSSFDIFNNKKKFEKKILVNVVGVIFGVSLILPVVCMLVINFMEYVLGSSLSFNITTSDAALLSLMSLLGIYLTGKCGIELVDIFITAANCSNCAASSIKTTIKFENKANNFDLLLDSVCINMRVLPSSHSSSKLTQKTDSESNNLSAVKKKINFFSILPQISAEDKISKNNLQPK